MTETLMLYQISKSKRDIFKTGKGGIKPFGGEARQGITVGESH
jgi:hypothetical protein